MKGLTLIFSADQGRDRCSRGWGHQGVKVSYTPLASNMVQALIEPGKESCCSWRA